MAAPELPKSIELDNYVKLKSDIGNWVQANQSAVANEERVTGSGSSYATYNIRKANKLQFDTFFHEALVTLFKKSFANCSECRENCPIVLEKLARDYGPTLNGVGFGESNDKVENYALCMEKLCPLTFSQMTCGTWRFQDNERKVALYAAGATAIFMFIFFCIIMSMFGSGDKSKNAQMVVANA